jgi:putative N-acetylmannosamine-6-phosphate epimerase
VKGYGVEIVGVDGTQNSRPLEFNVQETLNRGNCWNNIEYATIITSNDGT